MGLFYSALQKSFIHENTNEVSLQLKPLSMKKHQKVLKMWKFTIQNECIFIIAVEISCCKLGDCKEFILLFVMFMHMLLCAHVICRSCQNVQKRTSGSPLAELEEVVNHLTWLLKTELRFCGRDNLFSG